MLNGHQILAEPVQPAGTDGPLGELLDLRHHGLGEGDDLDTALGRDDQR